MKYLVFIIVLLFIVKKSYCLMCLPECEQLKSSDERMKCFKIVEKKCIMHADITAKKLCMNICIEPHKIDKFSKIFNFLQITTKLDSMKNPAYLPLLILMDITKKVPELIEAGITISDNNSALKHSHYAILVMGPVIVEFLKRMKSPKPIIQLFMVDLHNIKDIKEVWLMFHVDMISKHYSFHTSLAHKFRTTWDFQISDESLHIQQMHTINQVSEISAKLHTKANEIGSILSESSDILYIQQHKSAHGFKEIFEFAVENLSLEKRRVRKLIKEITSVINPDSNKHVKQLLSLFDIQMDTKQIHVHGFQVTEHSVRIDFAMEDETPIFHDEL